MPMNSAERTKKAYFVATPQPDPLRLIQPTI